MKADKITKADKLIINEYAINSNAEHVASKLGIDINRVKKCIQSNPKELAAIRFNNQEIANIVPKSIIGEVIKGLSANIEDSLVEHVRTVQSFDDDGNKVTDTYKYKRMDILKALELMGKTNVVNAFKVVEGSDDYAIAMQSIEDGDKQVADFNEG